MKFLLAMPVRFALRYGRWMARGAGVAMAALFFSAIERRETLQLPWMDEPYTVSTIDPYIAGALAYIITVRILISLMMRFYGAGQTIVRDLMGD